MTALPGAVRVTALPGAVRVITLPGAVKVTALPGDVFPEGFFEDLLFKGLQAKRGWGIL